MLRSYVSDTGFGIPSDPPSPPIRALLAGEQPRPGAAPLWGSIAKAIVELHGGSNVDGKHLRLRSDRLLYDSDSAEAGARRRNPSSAEAPCGGIGGLTVPIAAESLCSCRAKRDHLAVNVTL